MFSMALLGFVPCPPTYALICRREGKKDDPTGLDQWNDSLRSSTVYGEGSSSIPRIAAVIEKPDHDASDSRTMRGLVLVSRNSTKSSTSRWTASGMASRCRAITWAVVTSHLCRESKPVSLVRGKEQTNVGLFLPVCRTGAPLSGSCPPARGNQRNDLPTSSMARFQRPICRQADKSESHYPL